MPIAISIEVIPLNSPLPLEIPTPADTGSGTPPVDSLLADWIEKEPTLFLSGNFLESQYRVDSGDISIRYLSRSPESESRVRYRFLVILKQSCTSGCCAPGSEERSASGILNVDLDEEERFLIGVSVEQEE